MASEPFDPDDKFTRLAYELKDAGTKVIDDPDEVRHSADKAIAHFDLLRHGVPVPEAVVIRNWDPDRRLTAEEEARLGFPFVIKPARGFARQGVRVIGKDHALDGIELARQFSHDDDYILQQFIVPTELGGSPAWFRIYHLFGEIVPCWWHPETHVYRQMTLTEMERYNLLPIVRIVSEIGRITNVDWFSSEIALNAAGKFFVVDYVNDQCSMEAQSVEKDGVPDAVVVQIARRIVERANQHIHKRVFLPYLSLWFPQIAETENV
jgi:hypothetical protein